MTLAYASPRGRVLIKRELYIPASWLDDTGRCRGAGIPAGREFATKPQLMEEMPQRAIWTAVPFAWFTADEAYGDNPRLRAFCQNWQVPSVLAVSRDHRIEPAESVRVVALSLIRW